MPDRQSFNAIHGTTNNPWNLAMPPGDSSGGLVAALAAGPTELEAGSDVGASIRNPCHYCGAVGLKPIYGPLTRSARDLDLALSVMVGPASMTPPGASSCPKALFRVTVKLDDPSSEVDDAYQDKLQALGDTLAEAHSSVSGPPRRRHPKPPRGLYPPPACRDVRAHAGG